MRKLLKNHRGVSMVEVLITVAILAIVVAPCLAAFVTAQRGNVLAKETAAQYTEASNLMEELKAAIQNADEMSLDAVEDLIESCNDKSSSTHIVYSIMTADVKTVNEQTESPEQTEQTVPTKSYIESQRKTYINVWICPGMQNDAEVLLPNTEIQTDYILSGVITPNIAAESQASDLINELAKNAEEKKWAEVVARLEKIKDETEDPKLPCYVVYQIVAEDINVDESATDNYTHVNVWIYKGEGNDGVLPFDQTPSEGYILHGVIVPDSGIMEEAKILMGLLQGAGSKDAILALLASNESEGESTASSIYVLYRELADRTDESEENIDSLETDASDETNEAVKSTQIEVWICAGIDQPNRPLADDEISPENYILHGVIEFDSRNDSTEDPIESQADNQT